jgi:hypothetical protein
MDEIKLCFGQVVGHQIMMAHLDPLALELLEQVVSRSTASTEPVLPTRSASIRVTEPPPAPTSRQRQPSPTPIASS